MHPFRVFLAMALSFSLLGRAQPPVQTVKGQVLDRAVRTPLPGATVEVVGMEKGAVADGEGRFRIQRVPVGRRSLRVTCAGYRPVLLSNLSVESGKEPDLTVELEEVPVEQREIVVRGRVGKTRPLNEMALVSGRMFSVEETRRFAAGLNDPSRIATGFAGVQSQGDANALVIRGNAPNGLLWRLEGVDIPNPNHFARVGTSGGAISILSAQLLANSDFLTGAFPAEYGNALSGVFDIRLRKGNRDRREHTLSVSTIGLDAATEGPLKKGYGGSYLVNYRYGFLTLMQKVGFDIGDAPTSFSDLSFHVTLPTRRAGTFGVFGFGGRSRQEQSPDRDPLAWQRNTARRSGWLDAAETGAVGLTHSLNIGKRTLLRSVLSRNAFAYSDRDMRLDRYDAPLVYTRDNRFGEDNALASVTLTHKPADARHLLKAGAYATRRGFDLRQREWAANALRDKVRDAGRTGLANAFLQWRWTPLERLVLVAGVHGQHFALNGHAVAEPRLALRWTDARGRGYSLGIGRHAQVQPLGNYFARVRVGNDTVQPNRGLGFSRADHYVFGYAYPLSRNWNFKAEAYLQRLRGIPVHALRASSFSLVNQDDDYAIEPLANRGTGRNAGVELTLERFWNDQLYVLATLSLFDSRYRGSDGVWRDTRYNANAMSTFLAGREWVLKGRRTHTLAVDLKVMYGGGVRVTPIDLPRSIALRRQVLETDRPYADKLEPFSRTDLQGEWRVQYGRRTGALILGVQNLLGHRNPFRQYYDAASQSIRYAYLLGRIPVFGYRMDL
jgi:hypothetical protein